MHGAAGTWVEGIAAVPKLAKASIGVKVCPEDEFVLFGVAQIPVALRGWTAMTDKV